MGERIAASRAALEKIASKINTLDDKVKKVYNRH
jgi:hypothetical protein